MGASELALEGIDRVYSVIVFRGLHEVKISSIYGDLDEGAVLGRSRAFGMTMRHDDLLGLQME